MKKEIFKRFSTTQIIALGFVCVILVGTLLLMLPVAARSGESTPFLSAFFTATSATCVTGLVVVDTFTHWTIFGQLVILTMIQIGGLGFMTIAICFAIFMKRSISLRERGILKESVNTLQIGGVVKLTKKIVFGTVLFEVLGAVILSVRFAMDMGAAKGIYFGIFHAVSAFCNAGFDLMGGAEPYISMSGYVGDVVINTTIMLLIIIGGIGFIVWDDLYEHKLRFREYRLHTKIVLSFTLLLIFVGALLFYLFEKDHLLAGMGPKDTVLASLFCAVTPRTAGFNTVDTAALSQSSKLLTMVLMFIGGSPGSTAGGIKTTTMLVMLLFVWSNLRSSYGSNIYGRRLEEASIRKASIVFTINLCLAVTAAITICSIQPLHMEDILFEVFSAIGTVGMSTGVTRELVPASRVIIAVLMYCGRLGSMTFALSLAERKYVAPVQQPEEKIIIG